MPFNVLLVGAGEINFGSPEGPWNHTARLESVVGAALRFVGLLDPDEQRARTAIAEKQRSSAAAAWHDTYWLASVGQATSALDGVHIDLIVIGCPPHVRGTLKSGANIDVHLLRMFTNAKAVLLEKPVAAAEPASFDKDAMIAEYAQFSGAVSVGYMLRYLSAVQKMKQLLRDNHLVPTCINARYFMAYEYARKLSWWNKDASCGPVVEQATHFVDLIRYLAGSDYISGTVHAHTVEHDEDAGRLSKLGFDEEALIAPEQRVPRVTVASWKHARGTIGTLCHGITLHGTTYDTQLEVLADGWVMRLTGAYTEAPTLHITRPGAAATETICAPDDPFLTEVDVIVKAALGGMEERAPLSSYADALKTYELTWAIRKAGERSASELRQS